MTPETADARWAISGWMTLAKAAKLFGVGKTTLYQYLNSNAPRQGE
jgi:hypothetical protein